MSTAIIILHVIVCVTLILVVLLQTGKAADMGAAFGGGTSSSLFGSTGASTFLSKATTIAAIIFMATSLGLGYFSSYADKPASIMQEVRTPEQETATVPAEPVKKETEAEAAKEAAAGAGQTPSVGPEPKGGREKPQ